MMEHTMTGIEDICGQWSHFYWKDKFMKFNNRFLRRILIRDSRPESGIVALYKKLELQNAMEILDSVSGDISSAPAIVSLHEEKKGSAKPMKKFLAKDLNNMHNILSKNMYNIRQRTVAYTNKHALPNESQNREILIRRHSSIRWSFRPGSFQSTKVPKSQKYFSLPPGQSLGSKFPSARQSYADDHEATSEVGYPLRLPQSNHPRCSTSGAVMPLHRLNTLNEFPSVEVLNEKSPSHSASQDSSVPDCHFSTNNNGSADDLRNEEGEEQRPLPPSPALVAEPRNNTHGNPLLRRPQWNQKK